MVTRKFTISGGSMLSTFWTYRKRTKQENGEIEMRETKERTEEKKTNFIMKKHFRTSSEKLNGRKNVLNIQCAANT